MNYKLSNLLKEFNYYDELLEILFKNRTGALASNLFAPLGLVYILKDFIPISYLLFFLLFQFLLGYIRVYSSIKGLTYLRENKKDRVKKHLKLYLISLFFSSLLYGIIAILTIYYAEQLHVFIMVALVFGLIAGATSTLSTVYHAVVVYTVPFISLFVLGLLSSFIDIYLMLALVLTIFLVITLPSSLRAYTALKNNIEQKKIISDQKEQILENQAQLINTEKMASLGEMLANIAHQWRQPLSSISMVASGIKLEKELGIEVDEKELKERMDTIMTNSEYLSNTIDTFRDFLKNTKEPEDIVLQDRLDMVHEIVGIALKDAQIELIIKHNDNDSIIVSMIVGEFDQVLINIINNAKDILVEKEIINPWIKLEILKGKENAIITIEDNGGGIPDDIISKVFEAYFTTKHKSKGTGLGLHMSYKIVTQSLKGKLYVKNTDVGAKFFIEIPLKG